MVMVMVVIHISCQSILGSGPFVVVVVVVVTFSLGGLVVVFYAQINWFLVCKAHKLPIQIVAMHEKMVPMYTVELRGSLSTSQSSPARVSSQIRSLCFPKT